MPNNAKMGGKISNKVTLYYKNSVGVEFKPESDEPEVDTGGIDMEVFTVSGLMPAMAATVLLLQKKRNII